MVIGLAYAAALLLRFDAEVPRQNLEFVLKIFPLIAALYVVANYIFGVYRTVWGYGSLGDILALFRSRSSSSPARSSSPAWPSSRCVPAFCFVSPALLRPPSAS